MSVQENAEGDRRPSSAVGEPTLCPQTPSARLAAIAAGRLAGGQRTEFAINQLRMMQEFAQAPGLTPLSSELEEGLADVLTFAQALFGGMGDARDGFAQDIEHERN